jgi:DNA-binding response OmpR family regulator
MKMKTNRPILLVEDDMVDVMTVRRALREVAMTNPLRVVGNGEEALEYLRDDANARPVIILCDINMPTTSREEQDKLQSFRQSVAGYMVKPVNYEQFVEMMRLIDQYWSLSEFPE